MLIVALALVVVAATAAVVIRDAHPSPPKAAAEVPLTPAEPLVLDLPAPPADEPLSDVDAPTQSMPAPFAFAGSQAAALLPYQLAPEPIAEPEPAVRQPAAFVPAGTPYLQPDPDHLIQHEVVIDPDQEHSAAVTKLVIGIAVSGTAVGLAIVGAGRGIDVLIRFLAR